MGVFKRAFLYVTRKKVRSVLLFLIFFVTGLFLLTGLSIKQSVEEAAEDFRKTLTTGLIVEQKMIDPETVWDIQINEKGEEIITYKVPLMMEEHIEEFLAIEGVSGFYCDKIGYETGYTGLALRPGYEAWCLGIIEGTVPLEGDVTKEFRDYLMEEDNHKAVEVGAHTNSFINVYDSSHHPAFINGAVELTEGRHVKTGDEAKVLISDELAEKNGLNIGDKIEVRNSDIFTGEFYGSVYETEIIGVFHINFEQTVTEDKTYESEILANTFFSAPDIGFWASHEYQIQHNMDVIARESDRRLSSIVLFVEDPALLDSVKEKLLAIDSVDWSNYNFGIYDRDYQTAAEPLLSMIKTSTLLAVIPAVGVFVILSLIMVIWMRSRKYEIRILSSIGMKKSGILRQFMIECCVLAVTAFFAAVLLAGPAIKLAGDGLQTWFYSAGNEEGYEVDVPPGVVEMNINMLPPAKGEAFSYAVTPRQTCLVFALMTGTAMVSIFISLILRGFFAHRGMP